jgi:pyruvate kinase
MATSLRRTKIIATLGPATESEEMLVKLITAGVDVVRLNMAHAKHDWTRQIIRRIRAASVTAGREVAIMMDIKGPEIRTGDLEVPIELKPGEIFDFTVKPGAERDNVEEIRSVDVNYQDLVNDIRSATPCWWTAASSASRCSRRIRPTSAAACSRPAPSPRAGTSTCRASRSTSPPSPPRIAPTRSSASPRASILSRCRSCARRTTSTCSGPSSRSINSRARIVAKIEDQSAIDNLDDIIRATDVLMVARGDLGIEVPLRELPVIQRRAVRTCLAIGRPVIIATHMLESMISQPMPSRAEITDVANAVYEQADCVMLSGETTVGKYPLECVQVLDAIARRIEEEQAMDFPEPAVFIQERMKVFRAAVVLANEFPRSLLLVFTRHGTNAAGLAAHRPPRAPILAVTDSLETLRHLKMVRSVEPYLLTPFGDPEATIERANASLLKQGRITPGDKLVIVSDVQAKGRRIDSIQLRSVE